MAVATQGVADGVKVRAKLKGNAADDGAVARVGVGRRIALVIPKKDFSDPTIRESANSRGITEASNLEFECLAKAPIGKPFALLRRTHDSSENDRLSTGLAPLALPSFWRR
jgi:hypothetical protein